MKTEIKDITDTRKNLVVTVEAAEVDQEHQKLGSEFARQARLPGFRPGKAPMNLVLKRFEKQIADELHQKVISRAYQGGIEESKVDVINLVDVPEVPVTAGQPVEFTFTVDIRPEFEVPEYKGLKAEVPSTDVTDEEVDNAIDALRRERAEFNTVERESQAGDYVKFSLEGTVDGKPITEIAPDKPIYGKMPQTWEEVGSEEGLIPGLAKELGGLAKGGKKEINVEFPADFSVEPLAGKKAVYAVEVQEVRERVLPPLDDTFLKAQGVESLDQLKERAKESLQYRKEMENRNSIRRQVTEALSGKVEFPLPESLIESETQGILRQIVEQNIRRGVPQDELEKNKDEIYSEGRKSAIERVKVQLILAKVAEAESIKVEEKDINRFLVQEAMRGNTKPDKIAKELSKDRSRLRAIEQSILFDKTLDFLVNQATVSTASN